MCTCIYACVFAFDRSVTSLTANREEIVLLHTRVSSKLVQTTEELTTLQGKQQAAILSATQIRITRSEAQKEAASIAR